MSEQDTPESGTRCKVTCGGKEEVAVWTGHMWAAEDGSRIIDGPEVQSWTEAPSEGELKVIRQDEEDA